MNNKTIFGTYEWAFKNANFINGCSHNCLYCYSKEMAIRYKRKTTKNWEKEEINFAQLNKTFKKIDGTIMFPSSHDITPANLDKSIEFLKKLIIPGNKVLIVSKPHLIVIKRLCKELSNYKKDMLFRFTIGSIDTQTLKSWEPNAPTFEERFSALKYAFKSGFKTSVSCEPMLDNKTFQLVKKLEPYVSDSIWLGKANFLLRRLKMNGNKSTKALKLATDLLDSQNEANINELYNLLKHNKKVKWKESIKKIVNLDLAQVKGLDK
ncbi:MAG: radical SAM protein [Bacteroidales bacterium]|nr:radical SAM protein [Bacteroidales bacterium]